MISSGTSGQPGPPGSRRLEWRELGPLSEALARAFFDDPYYMFLFPDEAERRRLLVPSLRALVELTMPGGQVFTTPGAPVGVAGFVPPDRAVGFRHMVGPALRHGWKVGPKPAIRMVRTMAELEPLHPKERHWHLLVLGVDPAHQGQGIPGRLMADVLARADRDRLPVHLETTREANLGYYAKFGFRVTNELRLLGGKGPGAWTMLRAPRAAE